MTGMEKVRIKHPAKFTDRFLPVFAQALAGYTRVLDPMAGTGKLAGIKAYGWHGVVICNDLESEWRDPSYAVDAWYRSDAAHLDWCATGSIDAICTSPTYGNRLADHHRARDGSHRISYTHYLGHDLQAENTGKLQWGTDYQQKHEAIWRECYRVLRLGGRLVLNISNHIRHGQVIDVTGWHVTVLQQLGFRLEQAIRIATPRLRRGENQTQRVAYESICILTNQR